MLQLARDRSLQVPLTGRDLVMEDPGREWRQRVHMFLDRFGAIFQCGTEAGARDSGWHDLNWSRFPGQVGGLIRPPCG